MDVQRLRRRGILFIVSAPSGAGKTTISGRALREVGGLEMSISCTTRTPRAGEVDGRDYHFLERADFERRRAAGEFAESAEVHGFLYGTPRSPIDQALAAGRDLLLDIDVQGARQMKARYPEAVAVFVLPPSEGELARRLRGRGTDSPEVIARRLERARAEMAEYRSYDYYVVNRNVDESVRRLAAIVTAERHKVSRLVEG
ncbi:MAG: guanylate kinase [Deltaproteobacteria bacterium]|nr:guanylate kinase [Deltaproteobacteria bacterium]